MSFLFFVYFCLVDFIRHVKMIKSVMFYPSWGREGSSKTDSVLIS